eukprot:5200300-Pleurochrysis_carterae.AAC.1
MGSNEIEKFVHGIRNGEVIGGPANARRMRHATIILDVSEGERMQRLPKTGGGRDHTSCHKRRVRRNREEREQQIQGR